MGKIRRSCVLSAASLKFVAKNPRLLVFPFISLVAFTVIVALVVVGGAALSGMHNMPVRDFVTAAQQHLPIFVPLIAAGVFSSNFIVLFFQAALVGCVLLQMEGKPHGLTDGLSLAWSRRGALLKWTFVTSSVGLLLQLAERQFNRLPGIGPWIAKWIFRLVGTSWTLVTFLIIPVMVFEEQPGVWAQLRRSGQLFKRSWGEQVVGLGVILGPAYVVLGALMAIFLVMMVALGGVNLPTSLYLALGLSMGIFILFVSPVLRAMYSTYIAVLYGYAVTGMLPQEFTPDLLPPKPEASA
jgi:hypothetical protein